MHASRAPFILALSFFAASANAGVFGTMTGASAPPSADRKYDAATLRPADLKSCLVDAYSIDVADALFEAERPTVELEREELKKLQEATAGKPTGASAAASTELRMKAQKFNARVAALNSRVAYAQEARDRFSKTCKGRKYYFEDVAAVRGELPPEIASILPGK
jgi:hypothetical protein